MPGPARTAPDFHWLDSAGLTTARQPCIPRREKVIGFLAHDARLGRVVCELNIGRFRHILNTDIDAAKRGTVNRLLAEEQFYLKQLLAAGGS
jgi:hypothetical protein